jgi:hypothetical protein
VLRIYSAKASGVWRRSKLRMSNWRFEAADDYSAGPPKTKFNPFRPCENVTADVLLRMRGRKRAALFSPPATGLDIDNAGGSAFCARITREHGHTTADHNTGRRARLVENSRVRRYGRRIDGISLRREARERYSCHQKKKIFVNCVHANGRPALYSFIERNNRIGGPRKV